LLSAALIAVNKTPKARRGNRPAGLGYNWIGQFYYPIDAIRRKAITITATAPNKSVAFKKINTYSRTTLCLNNRQNCFMSIALPFLFLPAARRSHG
jgi:hypothetical protein